MKANIRYVAAYLAYWQDRWSDTLDISNMPEILGTLYNLGDNANEPNTSPKSNGFGRQCYYIREWVIGGFNMKLIKRLVAIILVVTGLYWGACLVKCEILTKRHGDEFSQLYQDNTMLGPQAYWKVLEYSDTHAAVYFVSEGGLGGGSSQVYAKRRKMAVCKLGHYMVKNRECR